MTLPVNFDSLGVDAIMADWLLALREHAVDALVVLGPDPFDARGRRVVLSVHPPRTLRGAQALADSDDFGLDWQQCDATLVAWQNLGKNPVDTGGTDWRSLWQAYGCRSLVRVAFPLPVDRAFECFMFGSRELVDRADASLLAWSALNVWPVLRRAIAALRVSLSPRELQSLKLAFEGLTARESAQHMDCSERTVNYHLANAMTKLRTDNKLSAVQRACLLGLI